MRLAVPATLAALSLLLLGATAYELVAPLDPIVVEKPRLPAAGRPATPPPSYTPPPETLFADIDARPIFSSARKPLMEAAQASALPASSDFALVGVILGGERAVALLRIKSTNTTTSAALGDLVNGWRVAQIGATAVTLRANGTDAVVAIEGPTSQGPGTALPSRPLQPPPIPATAAPGATNPAPAPAPTPALVTTQASPAPTPAAPHPYHPTIAPEALRSAPIDPTTGEPTL
jgi:hypothetical protein